MLADPRSPSRSVPYRLSSYRALSADESAGRPEPPPELPPELTGPIPRQAVRRPEALSGGDLAGRAVMFAAHVAIVAVLAVCVPAVWSWSDAVVASTRTVEGRVDLRYTERGYKGRTVYHIDCSHLVGNDRHAVRFVTSEEQY